MDALKMIPTGLESAQNIQNTRAAQTIASPRERGGVQPQSLQSEQLNATASVQVKLSEAGRAAASSGLSSSLPPMSGNFPAAPVQTPDAVTRAGSAGSAGRVERQDAAASTAASREAMQRYMENANNKLPAGQSGPSSVRVSA